MADPVLRLARPDDADAIGDIHCDGWRTGYVGLVPDSYLAGLDAATSRDRWRRQLASPGETRTVVAELDGVVVGFGSGAPCYDPDCPREERWGEVWDLFVRASCRGRGVGAMLLDDVLAALREAGHREAVLWVIEGNVRALRTYARAGFVDDRVARTQQLDGFTMRDLRLRKQL